MHRIDTATKSVDKHGTGKHGYRAGTPAGTDPTLLTPEMFDSLQEELALIVEAGPLPLTKTLLGQVRDTLRGAELVRAAANQIIGSYSAGDVLNTMCGKFESAGIIAAGDNGEIARKQFANAAWAAMTPAAAYAGNFLGSSSLSTTRVICGTAGEIQTSAAGGAFAQRKTGGDALNAVANNGNVGSPIWVAVGDNGDVWTSTTLDPTSWTDRTFSAGGNITGIAFGNGRFVICVDTGADGKLWWSTDGISWTEVTPADVTGIDYRGIVYESGYGFFASDATEGHRSTDGLSWGTKVPYGGTPVQMVGGWIVFKTSDALTFQHWDYTVDASLGWGGETGPFNVAYVSNGRMFTSGFAGNNLLDAPLPLSVGLASQL